MHRVLWAALAYVLLAGLVLIAAPTGTFTDERGRLRAFGLNEGQSTIALCALLPVLGLVAYATMALIDLVTLTVPSVPQAVVPQASVVPQTQRVF